MLILLFVFFFLTGRALGFQGDAPASDFRSMGVLALDQLVYFAENCTTEVRMIISVQNSQSTENYYPVATAGIIVSSMLLSAIEQRLKSSEIVPGFCFVFVCLKIF